MYKLHVTLEVDNKKWEEDLSFTVDAKTSKMIENAEQPIDNTYIWYIAIIVVLIRLISVLIYFLFKKRNKNN